MVISPLPHLSLARAWLVRLTKKLSVASAGRTVVIISQRRADMLCGGIGSPDMFEVRLSKG